MSTFVFALQTAQKHCPCLKYEGQTDLKLFNVFHFAKQPFQLNQQMCVAMKNVSASLQVTGCK